MAQSLCSHCAGMGSKRFDAFLVDSEDLIRWYKRRPENVTHNADHAIAAELGWFPRGQLEGRGDANRVQSVRRHVDRCGCFFDEFSFGTKRSLSGRHTSRLRERGDLGASEAVVLHLGEQMGRIIQADDHLQSELAHRALPQLANAQEDLIALGDMAKAFCVQDMIRDIEQFNTITPRTRAEAQRLGIPVPRLA